MAPNASTVGAVFKAANQGGAHTVAAWLDQGGGVDAHCAELEGMTLLMAAASGGQGAMVRMLLQRGASVNLQNSHGETALMGAAAFGHTTIVQALLDAKADASLQSTSGGTALMHAAAGGHTTTVQALLDAKADASLQSTDGSTALMWAEHQEHAATAQRSSTTIDGLQRGVGLGVEQRLHGRGVAVGSSVHQGGATV